MRPPAVPAVDVRPHDVLVVAIDAAGPGDAAHILDWPGGAIGEVLVVSPTLNSWSGRLVRDAGAADRDARRRLEATVRALRDAGYSAAGIVGDADPLLAIGDALAVFAADEVVVATVPARADGWLGETLVARARAHCRVPVRHAAVTHEPPEEVAPPLAAA